MKKSHLNPVHGSTDTTYNGCGVSISAQQMQLILEFSEFISAMFDGEEGRYYDWAVRSVCSHFAQPCMSINAQNIWVGKQIGVKKDTINRWRTGVVSCTKARKIDRLVVRMFCELSDRPIEAMLAAMSKDFGHNFTQEFKDWQLWALSHKTPCASGL